MASPFTIALFSNGKEIAGNGYARQVCPISDWVADLSGAIVFPEATGEWGTIDGVAIMLGDNPVVLSRLAMPSRIWGGDTVRVNGGELVAPLRDALHFS